MEPEGSADDDSHPESGASPPPPNWGIVFDLGLRLGISVGVGLGVGLLLDNWLGTRPIFTLIGMVVGIILSYFVRLSLFRGTDRLLGFVFGLLRGIVLLGVFVILAQLLKLDSERWWHKSKLIPYGESIANGLRAVIGEQISGTVSASRESPREPNG